MQIDLQQKILKNHLNTYLIFSPLLLRENSYWYKYLNRGEENFQAFERMMKERYKVRMQDKMENISQGLQMIRTLMDVLR